MAWTTPGTATAGEVLTASFWNEQVRDNLNTTYTYGKLAYFRDEQTDGTNGGTFTNGAWRTRTLNTTVINNITGASLASNQITLPAGTYWFLAHAPALNCDNHRALIYNVTDAANALLGDSAAYSSAAGNVGDRAIVQGPITIAAQKVFELRHRCATTRNGNGLGAAAQFGVVEVYSQIWIWKIS